MASNRDINKVDATMGEPLNQMDPPESRRHGDADDFVANAETTPTKAGLNSSEAALTPTKAASTPDGKSAKATGKAAEATEVEEEEQAERPDDCKSSIGKTLKSIPSPDNSPIEDELHPTPFLRPQKKTSTNTCIMGPQFGPGGSQSSLTSSTTSSQSRSQMPPSGFPLPSTLRTTSIEQNIGKEMYSGTSYADFTARAAGPDRGGGVVGAPERDAYALLGGGAGDFTRTEGAKSLPSGKDVHSKDEEVELNNMAAMEELVKLRKKIQSFILKESDRVLGPRDFKRASRHLSAVEAMVIRDKEVMLVSRQLILLLKQSKIGSILQILSQKSWPNDEYDLPARAKRKVESVIHTIRRAEEDEGAGSDHEAPLEPAKDHDMLGNSHEDKQRQPKRKKAQIKYMRSDESERQEFAPTEYPDGEGIKIAPLNVDEEMEEGIEGGFVESGNYIRKKDVEMEEKREKMKQFISVTKASSVEAAKELCINNWNVQVALDAYFAAKSGAKLSSAESVQELGYAFNEQGQLRRIHDSQPFNFEVRPNDEAYNQAHYEVLGSTVTAHIEDELQTKFDLVRTAIPIDAREEEPTSHIYLSREALTSDRPILMLVPGSLIKVGQWSRKIVINDNINTGSIYNYIRAARKAGYEIVALNPNCNMDAKSKKMIRGSEDPDSHVQYVWQKIVAPAKSQDILIVAHSAGGYSTKKLVLAAYPSIKDRVKAIALTDSVHGRLGEFGRDEVDEWWYQHAINWVASLQPLGTTVRNGSDCVCRSAGDNRHEYTTVSAQKQVIEFFRDRLAGALFRSQDEREVSMSDMDEETNQQILRGSGERDISEKNAWGLGQPIASKKSIFEQQTFNQNGGMSSGIAAEESYNLYDKPLFGCFGPAASYPPKHGEKEANLKERLKRMLRMKPPDCGFAETERRGGTPWNGPERFETEHGDVFELEGFMNTAKGGMDEDGDGVDVDRAQINNNFAKLAEPLFITNRIAHDDLKRRIGMKMQKDNVEKITDDDAATEEKGKDGTNKKKRKKDSESESEVDEEVKGKASKEVEYMVRLLKEKEKERADEAKWGMTIYKEVCSLRRENRKLKREQRALTKEQRALENFTTVVEQAVKTAREDTKKARRGLRRKRPPPVSGNLGGGDVLLLRVTEVEERRHRVRDLRVERADLPASAPSAPRIQEEEEDDFIY
ncbi:hypothetical protein HK097_007830 [Rhizophlyctis rosea]|uniref:Arb2 domain-containing protein n=1 Tax=Rhizophlyctis rosea TaxID=64517 RepID=A0AAD5X4Y9_9FUNG|nr:hypothetical protein HK097_007830 [Rhizophlyctis rosea]